MDAFPQEKLYKIPICDRIPTLQHLENEETFSEERLKEESRVEERSMKKPTYVLHRYYKDNVRRIRKENRSYSYCFLSVLISFLFGLALGVVLFSSTQSLIEKNVTSDHSAIILERKLNSLNQESLKNTIDVTKKSHDFSAVSFTGDKAKKDKYKKDVYPKGLTEDMKDILKDNKDTRHTVPVLSKTDYTVNDKTVLYDNVYWGPEVEDSMPQGYGYNSAEIWERYVNQSEVVRMQVGCGRMQNRLVTFKDGIQACVRYRQNTDQIQGEIFSFYVAQLMNLTNLAPSVVKIVDLKDKLWANVANDISNAQWNTNRAVVLTQYIPNLESAKIPDVFKPSNRHLNKNDVLNLSSKENEEKSKQVLIDKLKSKNIKANKGKDNFAHIDTVLNKNTRNLFVELAQWSDLIIFDYLTANLDRIVNNLFNFQWNINIMDGPAHNLAKKMDSGLLIFLDNESGLLHGYRLLKKYNVYHSLMLDNLCVFRKTTINALKNLYSSHTVGKKLNDLFHSKNNIVIRDILPSLPEKNAKILHERIGKVLSQVEQCEVKFSNR